MANHETITSKVIFNDTANNRNFAKQIYTFTQDVEKNKVHDDNIDCLNNAIIAYKSLYKILGGDFD